jgi:nuclear pore complex protein Nup205
VRLRAMMARHSARLISNRPIVWCFVIKNVSLSGSSAQRVRANLYGGLLNYLRIGGGGGGSGNDDSIRSTSLELTEQAKFRKSNLELMLSFGDNFLDILCRDTVSGHDIRRMLALSVLDELVRLDGRGTWTHYMSAQVRMD